MADRKFKSRLFVRKSPSGPPSLAEAQAEDVIQDAEKLSEPPHGGGHVGATSGPLADTLGPVTEDAGSKQPRKATKTQEIKEQSARVVGYEYGPGAGHDDPFAPTSLVGTHGRVVVRGTEQSKLPSGGLDGRISTSPHSIYCNPESGNDQDVERLGKPFTTLDRSIQSGKGSQIVVFQDPFVEPASVQGGTRGTAPFYPDARPTSVTEAERFPTTSPPILGPVEQPSEIERSYEEKDRLLALMKAEREHSKLLYEQRIEELRLENQRLAQRAQFNSGHNNRPETPRGQHVLTMTDMERLLSVVSMTVSQSNEKDRIITSLTNQVAEWREADALKAQEITIVRRENERLRLDLSAAATREVELHQRCSAVSRELGLLRGELQTNTLLVKHVGHSIASVMDVAQWKKQYITSLDEVTQTKYERDVVMEELATARAGAEQLRTELSSVNFRFADLQKRCETQLQEVNNLYLKEIGRQDLGETPENDIVDKLHCLLGQKDERIEELNCDLDTSTSRIDELQKENEALSKDINNARDEPGEKTSQYSQLSGPHSHSGMVESAECSLDLTCAFSTVPNQEVNSMVERPDRGITRLSAATVEQVAGKTRNKNQKRNYKRPPTQNVNQSTSKEAASLAEPHASDLVSKQAELSQDEVGDPNSLPGKYTSMGSQTNDRNEIVAWLTGQVAQWKKEVAQNKKHIDILCSENEKLRESLSQDLQFFDEVARAKHESSVAIEQLATAHSDIHQLQKELALANSRIADAEGLHEAQSQELRSVQDQIDLLFPGRTGDTPGKAETSVADKLHCALEWKNKHMEELLFANKEREQLRLIVQDLELEKRNHMGQSRELEECLSQLDAKRRFTTATDKHTDTAIAGMLQKLSAEIQQNTMFIAESISENYEHPGEMMNEERMSAIQNISECIGEKLANCLSGDDVALYLSIALQAYLSYHLCNIISLWTIDEGNNDFIKAVYHRLQEKEAQMISGNWRSLTRTYLESHPDSHISSTFAGFCDIIVASGYAVSVSAAELMLSPFKDKLSTMMSIAGQLSGMIGEVMSRDLEVFVVDPNEEFEETTMEEDVDDLRKEGDSNVTAVGQKVLCSTCLGLTKRVTLELGEKKMATVIKAKVLIESFLEGA